MKYILVSRKKFLGPHNKICPGSRKISHQRWSDRSFRFVCELRWNVLRTRVNHTVARSHSVQLSVHRTGRRAKHLGPSESCQRVSHNRLLAPRGSNLWLRTVHRWRSFFTQTCAQ
uniref:Uncharacterized protein n=1 Tax=Sipha flava TaxID=143950 RepID=A0A2S2Q874_9HEMI